MNRCNDWKGLLERANEDLDKHGYSLLIVEPEEGFYNCEICLNGRDENEVYAENYYEDELYNLIMDVWHDIKLTLV